MNKFKYISEETLDFQTQQAFVYITPASNNYNDYLITKVDNSVTFEGNRPVWKSISYYNFITNKWNSNFSREHIIPENVAEQHAKLICNKQNLIFAGNINLSKTKSCNNCFWKKQNNLCNWYDECKNSTKLYACWQTNE